MTMTASQRLPLILDEVEVVSIERLSPAFMRVELGGPALADFGVDGRLFDQRIKLIFPGASGTLPSFAGADESWYASWLALPLDERGHMRTYTARDVRGFGEDTRLVVDFVLHHENGASGPASSWAASANPGDRVVLIGPQRGKPFGGIEFAPGAARRLLLAGDETAVPAICRILADLDADALGTAFLEVPGVADVLDVSAPPGVDVVWLPREGVAHGARQVAAIRRHLGLPVDGAFVPDAAVVDEVWETPTYSSSGEEIVPPAGNSSNLPDLYAWLAGESTVVTTLRRCLVRELGLERRQVAFMGYWRRGVAMRS